MLTNRCSSAQAEASRTTRVPASQPREQQVPHAAVRRIHLFFPMKKVKCTSMMTTFADQFNHFLTWPVLTQEVAVLFFLRFGVHRSPLHVCVQCASAREEAPWDAFGVFAAHLGFLSAAHFSFTCPRRSAVLCTSSPLANNFVCIF